MVLGLYGLIRPLQSSFHSCVDTRASQGLDQMQGHASKGLKREATIVDDLAENNEIMRVAASTIAAMVMLAPHNM